MGPATTPVIALDDMSIRGGEMQTHLGLTTRRVDLRGIAATKPFREALIAILPHMGTDDGCIGIHGHGGQR
jgi:hypothetical protein